MLTCPDQSRQSGFRRDRTADGASLSESVQISPAVYCTRIARHAVGARSLCRLEA